MSILLLLVAIVSLTILVVVHELGHFWVAKKSGVWVEEFGIGLPPRAWGKKIGETLYSINWLPIGGFVRLHGETSEQKITDKKRAFINASKKVKVAVALGGVAGNFIFAALIFVIVGMIVGVPNGKTVVGVEGVSEGSPAANAGIQTENAIVSVNGQRVPMTGDFIQSVQEHVAQDIVLHVRSGLAVEDLVREVRLVARENPPEGQGAIGVVISDASELYRPPLWRIDIYIIEGLKITFFATRAVVIGMVGLFVDLSSGGEAQGVAGPLGIVAIIFEIFRRFGFERLLAVMAMISINLALINLLPIPPLDGSRVLMAMLEGVLGKVKNQKVEKYAFTIGMAIVLVFFVAVTASEVPRFIAAGSVSGFVDGILGI